MGCSEEVCIIAAMLSVKDIWLHPRGVKTQRDKLDASVAEFAVKEGDHITYLNVFRDYEEEGRSNTNNSSSEGVASWCSENMLSERSLKKAYEVRKQLLGYLSLHVKQNKWKDRLFNNNSNSDASSTSLKIESCGEDTSIILKCFLKGFFANVARLGRDGLYHTLRGNNADMTVRLAKKKKS
jgi:HrpA-like RNA helicase